MRHPKLVGLFVTLIAVISGSNLTAQTAVDRPVSEDAPMPANGSGPFANGQVIQASGSGTVASRLLERASFRPVTDQVKFEVQILRVDSDTRDQMYSELDADRMETEIAAAGELSREDGDKVIDEELSSRHTVDTGSIVTTAVLGSEQIKRFYELARESGSTEAVARPQIIAAVGQVAGIQQQVQRPFLAGIEEVESGKLTGIQSELQVLTEGTDFTVKADLDGEAIKVRARLRHSKVTDVEEHRVYGIGDGQKSIQVPSHEIRQAIATQRLLPTETLLLDPYITTTVTVAENVPQPVIDKIPYVNETFNQTRAVERKMHLIVLLKATKLAPPNPVAQAK